MPGGHSRVTYIQQVPVLLGNWFYEAHGGSTLSERGPVLLTEWWQYSTRLH